VGDATDSVEVAASGTVASTGGVEVAASVVVADSTGGVTTGDVTSGGVSAGVSVTAVFGTEGAGLTGFFRTNCQT